MTALLLSPDNVLAALLVVAFIWAAYLLGQGPTPKN